MFANTRSGGGLGFGFGNSSTVVPRFATVSTTQAIPLATKAMEENEEEEREEEEEEEEEEAKEKEDGGGDSSPDIRESPHVVIAAPSNDNGTVLRRRGGFVGTKDTATAVNVSFVVPTVVNVGPEDTERVLRTVQLSMFLQLCTFTTLAIFIQLHPAVREVVGVHDIDISQAWQLSLGVAFFGALVLSQQATEHTDGHRRRGTRSRSEGSGDDTDVETGGHGSGDTITSVSLPPSPALPSGRCCWRKDATSTTRETKDKVVVAPPTVISVRVVFWVLTLCPMVTTLALFDHDWYGTVVLCALSTATLLAMIIRWAATVTARAVVDSHHYDARWRVDTGAQTAQRNAIFIAVVICVLMLIGMSLVLSHVIDVGHYLIAAIVFFAWMMIMHVDSMAIEAAVKLHPSGALPHSVAHSKAVSSYIVLSTAARGFVVY